MILAPSCLLGLLLALVPVSQAVADCTDPPGPGVTWRRCVFDRLEFQNVNLTGAELRDASFLRADLSGATLTKVGAFRAKFVNTTLTGADLTDADLAEVDMTKADLQEARLLRATLRRARLFDATLRAAAHTGPPQGKA